MSDRANSNETKPEISPTHATSPDTAASPPEPKESDNANHSDSKVPLPLAAPLKPLSILDAKVADFVNWLENISLVKLAATLSEAALLFALVSYLVTIPERRQQMLRNARKTIFERTDREYSQGRIDALTTLNKLCANNPGMEAPNAQLPNLDLTRCHVNQRWVARLLGTPVRENVQGMDLSYSNLAGTNLSESNLSGSNLEGSNLMGVNLSKADLTGTNLSRANLTDANLSGAILNGANLSEATLTRTSFNGAQLKNANLENAIAEETHALWADLEGANLHHLQGRSANFNRANLSGAELYKADLSDSQLKFANFKNKASLRETNVKNADLRGAQFDTVIQVERAQNWQSAKLDPNWRNKIAVNIDGDRSPRLQIGLIKPTSDTSIFQAYEIGMRRAASRRVEVWGIPSESDVESEAATIRRAIENGIDAIVLVPEDPQKSIPAIRAAYEAGIVVITVDFCFEDEEALQYVFACYDTDSLQMGYDSGKYVAQWARTKRRQRFRQSEDTRNRAISPFSDQYGSRQNDNSKSEQPLKIGLVDAAKYERYYPNLQGFLQAMEDSGVAWEEVAATDAIEPSEVGKVEQMLRDHPEIEVLWGGSNSATKIALKAVENLGWSDRVTVFGIFNLSKDNAERLLDPKNPLQSIIDQQGVGIGREAVTTAKEILRAERSGYKKVQVEHRLLAQEEPEAVRESLDEANSIQVSPATPSSPQPQETPSPTPESATSAPMESSSSPSPKSD